MVDLRNEMAVIQRPWDVEKQTADLRRRLKMGDIRIVKNVGKGAMGTVFIGVVDGDEGRRVVAVKVMTKAQLDKKTDGHKRARTELFILSLLACDSHPFIPRLLSRLETPELLGFVVDYCPGGNLHGLRSRQKGMVFPESFIRFYAAEIVMALEHLHKIGIVYRDLKSENVLIQENGHIMLTDYDLSTRLITSADRDLLPLKRNTNRPSCMRIRSTAAAPGSLKKGRFRRKNTWGGGTSKSRVNPQEQQQKQEEEEDKIMGRNNSFVGTKEYVAPEMVRGNGHDTGVDWWALGVLMYEMKYGQTPFRGATRKETFYRVLAKEPDFSGAWTPLRDLLLRLLRKDPHTRFVSARAVKSHMFFRGLDWDSLQTMDVSAPYVPPPVDLEDLEALPPLDLHSLLGP